MILLLVTLIVTIWQTEWSGATGGSKAEIATGVIVLNGEESDPAADPEIRGGMIYDSCDSACLETNRIVNELDHAVT